MGATSISSGAWNSFDKSRRNHLTSRPLSRGRASTVDYIRLVAMLKRIFTILPPMLVGVVVGYYLHDFRSLAKQSAVLPEHTVSNEDRGRLLRSTDIVAYRESMNFNSLTHHSQPAAADLSASQIVAALGRLKDIPDLQQRTNQFGMLLRRWLEKDGRSAFAYVNSLDEGEMKMQGVTLMVEILARSDPQFLAEETLSMPGSRSSGELIRGLSRIWSQTDVQSALAWAAQLPDGVDKNDALLNIRSQWASQDPEAASSQISQLPENSSTAGLISAVAERWGSSNPAKAVEWAETLPESEKTLAMSSLAGVWAQRNPMAAGIFVAQLPPGETQNEAVKSVISSWAGQSPSQTAAWVLQFPAGPLQDHGIRQVVSAWNNVDPEGVQDWAMNLPAGATRDAALKNFSQTIAYWTPEKAARIAMLINDPSEREQSVETILRSWSQTDPASARNWLGRLDLPNELRVRLQIAPPIN
jgi:hypothetical protein